MKYYVTVYEVGLAYGGPEEGGWYFDHGTPVMHPLNAMFDTHESALEYTATIKPLLESQNREEGRREPSSVLATGDYLVPQIDKTIPAPYPVYRPRYE